MISMIVYGILGLLIISTIVAKIKYNNRIKKYAAEHNITMDEAKEFFAKKEKDKKEKEEQEQIKREEEKQKRLNKFLNDIFGLIGSFIGIVIIALILWLLIKWTWM